MSFPSSEIKNKKYYKFKIEIREGELLNMTLTQVERLIELTERLEIT